MTLLVLMRAHISKCGVIWRFGGEGWVVIKMIFLGKCNIYIHTYMKTQCMIRIDGADKDALNVDQKQQL